MIGLRKLWAAAIAVVIGVGSATAATPAPAPKAQLGAKLGGESARVYDRVRPAVAWILCLKEMGGEEVVSEGTAWVVDRENRLLVTNNHIVSGARKMVVFFPEWKDGKLMTDREWYARNGTKIRVQTVVTDTLTDLAVVKADELPTSARALRVAARSPEAGDGVFTVGHPAHVDDLWATSASSVRTVGPNVIVTRDGERFDGMCQETRLTISPGASGSPVVNAAGEVVGVVFSGYFPVEGKPAARAFSVDVTEVRKVLAAARRVGAEDAGVARKPSAEAQARKPLAEPARRGNPDAPMGYLESLLRK